MLPCPLLKIHQGLGISSCQFPSGLPTTPLYAPLLILRRITLIIVYVRNVSLSLQYGSFPHPSGHIIFEKYSFRKSNSAQGPVWCKWEKTGNIHERIDLKQRPRQVSQCFWRPGFDSQLLIVSQHSSQTSFVARPAICSMNTEGAFPGFKQHKSLAEYACVSSTKLRNAWSYNSTPPTFSVAARN